MPRYRKLHTKTLESLDVNDMPDDFTRLLWVLLPLALCREGRGIDNARWVQSRIFPLREDVTLEQVSAALDWLQNRGMIVSYQVEDRGYFHVPTFHAYQGKTLKETESPYPAPPASHQSQAVDTPEREERATATTPELPQSESAAAPDLLPTNSAAAPDLLPTNSGVAPDLLPTNSGTDANADADAGTDANADAAANKSARPRAPTPAADANGPVAALLADYGIAWTPTYQREFGGLDPPFVEAWIRHVNERRGRLNNPAGLLISCLRTGIMPADWESLSPDEQERRRIQALKRFAKKWEFDS